MLQDNYAKFSTTLSECTKALEYFENEEFADFARSLIECTVQHLAAHEAVFTELLSDTEKRLADQPEDSENWLKAKENRDCVAFGLGELQAIRRRFEAILAG